MVVDKNLSRLRRYPDAVGGNGAAILHLSLRITRFPLILTCVLHQIYGTFSEQRCL